MGFNHGLFNLGVVQARAGNFVSIGEADGQRAGFDYVFPEFREIDLIESVGHGVIVEKIIAFFLVGHEVGTPCSEVEIVGAPIGVGGEGRGVQRL